jgi:hypothetical protein
MADSFDPWTHAMPQSPEVAEVVAKRLIAHMQGMARTDPGYQLFTDRLEAIQKLAEKGQKG